MSTTTAQTHSAKLFDRYWRVLSVLLPLLIVPAIQWGAAVNRDLEELRLQVRDLSTRGGHERQTSTEIAGEMRAMRTQLEQFRIDVVQRIATLEARLEKPR